MIRKTCAILLVLFAAVAATGGEDFGFDPICESQKAASAYLVPENQLIFKLILPNGKLQQFERDLSSPDGRLRNAFGWSGRLLDGQKIRIKSAEGSRFTFDRGRLVSFRHAGKTTAFDYSAKRALPANMPPPLEFALVDSVAAARDYARKEFLHKWDGTGRLQFPFVNPNISGAFYAELLILSVFGVLFFSKRALRFGCGIAGAAFAACLIWTMSRGAWLGAILGLMPFFVLRLRAILKSRWTWIALGFVAVLIVGWIVLFGSGQVTRGFNGVGGNWTNAIRMEIMGNAPRLMYDAPGGWGFCGSGPAYVNWYQPLHVFALTPTLINAHLTWLAEFGWCGRYFLILAWIAVFALGLGETVRRRNPLLLSLLTALFVPACFNPILVRFAVWIAPLACLALALARLPRYPVRLLVASFAVCAVAAGAVVTTFYLIGETDALQHRPRLFVDGRRTMIGGSRPKVWIADRGLLGGGLTGKDIRTYYAFVPTAPALGFVSEIADLPESGIDRLVLSGKSATDWLVRLSESEEARRHLPKTVVFVSPTFSPDEIPEGVMKMCKVEVVVGEFAAMYDPDFAKPFSFVTVVPGMELYIVNWMDYVFGG